MPTIKTEYLGQLRTRATHVNSGNTLITDAPLDNHGKGAAFSPSDLLVTALTSCMMTLMGITANRLNIPLENVYAETEKTMGSEPRRVSRIDVEFTISGNHNYSTKEKSLLEKAALGCPVLLSLNTAIERNIQFHWPEDKEAL